MPNLKLTKTAITRLKAPDPSGKQTLHWDTELKGFGVLCSGTTNSKTYVVQRDINGKSRRVTVGPVNVLSLDAARDGAKRELALMYQGIDPKAHRRALKAQGVTLRQTLEGYLQTRKDLGEKTAKEYRRFVERHLADWLDRPLRDITSEMVEKRHRSIKEGVEKRGKVGGAKGHASANGTMRVLRLLWNYAAERQPELPDNPVKRLRRAWYPDERREQFVKPSELPGFYEAVTKLPNEIQRDYILFALFTGLRRREAATLRWDDVDLKDRMIRLPAERTKGRRKLDLPMSDFVADLLMARRTIGQDGPYVFPANSRSGHIEEPRFALDEVKKTSGIKVRMHDLRRTFITVAEECEMSVYALKALVNHSLGRDVTAGYIQLGPERLREPMQRITDRLKELIGITGPEGENVEKLKR
ncbi:MAG: integrase family protein [Alphaproteobacteria bacterium]